MCRTCYISYKWQGSECHAVEAVWLTVVNHQLGGSLDQAAANQTQYLPSFDPPVASVAGWDQAP